MPRKCHDRNQARKDALERQRRIRLLIRYQKISSADDIPPHAIPVDPDKTLLAATWSPTVYYEDIHFTCCDCGADECWTADSQMRYFEEKKAGIYNYPKRCYACRQKERISKEVARRSSGHAKPNRRPDPSA